MKAVNSFKQPDRVVPRPLDAPRPGRRMTLKVPAAPYTVLGLAVE